MQLLVITKHCECRPSEHCECVLVFRVVLARLWSPAVPCSCWSSSSVVEVDLPSIVSASCFSVWGWPGCGHLWSLAVVGHHKKDFFKWCIFGLFCQCWPWLREPAVHDWLLAITKQFVCILRAFVLVLAASAGDWVSFGRWSSPNSRTSWHVSVYWPRVGHAAPSWGPCGSWSLQMC